MPSKQHGHGSCTRTQSSARGYFATPQHRGTNGVGLVRRYKARNIKNKQAQLKMANAPERLIWDSSPTVFAAVPAWFIQTTCLQVLLARTITFHGDLETEDSQHELFSRPKAKHLSQISVWFPNRKPIYNNPERKSNSVYVCTLQVHACIYIYIYVDFHECRNHVFLPGASISIVVSAGTFIGWS